MTRRPLLLVCQIAALLAGLPLAACATIGEPFDTTHVAELRRGEQDRAQVKAWFGEPHQRTEPRPGETTDCVEHWHYGHADSTAGGTTHSDVLMVGFDAEGRVCEIGYARTR